MKTEKSIFLAFILNLVFSVCEFIGGGFIGSVVIVSDALHDASDAASIGISYFLEKKSRRLPDEKYTYGYTRFSVIGGLITSAILIFGSFIVIYNSVLRIIEPAQINYDGMILFGIIGVGINLVAALLTRKGDSLNQKAVNLHMLEDSLGWAAVLLGAIVMKLTNISIIDPIMSIGVAAFILIGAVKTLKEVLCIFLQKVPSGVSVEQIKSQVESIEGVYEVYHIHLWSMDGKTRSATMHVVTDPDRAGIKAKVRLALKDMGITHSTIELESKCQK